MIQALVTRQIHLTGRPNNVSVTPDGRKVYVAITGGDTFVDVIDTRTQQVVRSIPTLGGPQVVDVDAVSL